MAEQGRVLALSREDCDIAVKGLPGLSLLQERYLFLMLTLSRLKGFCWMHQASLARELRLKGTRTVETLTKWAVDQKYLRVTRTRDGNHYTPNLKAFGFEAEADAGHTRGDCGCFRDPSPDLPSDPQRANTAEPSYHLPDCRLFKELAAAAIRIDDLETSRTRQVAPAVAPRLCSASLVPPTPAYPANGPAISAAAPDGSLEVMPETADPMDGSGASTELSTSRQASGLPRTGAVAALRSTASSGLLPPELEAQLYALPQGSSALRWLIQQRITPAHAERAVRYVVQYDREQKPLKNAAGFLRTVLSDHENEPPPEPIPKNRIRLVSPDPLKPVIRPFDDVITKNGQRPPDAGKAAFFLKKLSADLMTG